MSIIYSDNEIQSDNNGNDKQTNTKQQREDDDIARTSKRYKNTSTPTTSLNNVEMSSQQKEIAEMRAGMIEMQNCIKQLTTNITTVTAVSTRIEQHIAEINKNVATITTQVKELQMSDIENKKEIRELKERIAKMEQKALDKNIEIGNVMDENMDVYELLKQISECTGVEINTTDVNRAYKVKRKNKIIVELSTVNKKIELMSKIKRHKVEIRDANGENNVVYVNEELTAYNKRLLWMAKTKAKEMGWKFVWVKNGNIYARKNENSSFTIIHNSTDIEDITSTN
ncbi:uncharacterized protein LOC133338785 [Musca vetustissima]|uniref:uncharacterized protein LOC133338785 n=1 Tax=Musca vetustissima TaxID=27455 RepID=UPI002AB6B757|nr:uncharacterized protein LOC133338785 [Musca vetustissima]